MSYATYSNLEYIQRVQAGVCEKVKQASYQPYRFDGPHPITQLATAYSAGIEAMVQLQRVYEAINDLRSVVLAMNSMHEQNLDCSVGLSSLNMLLERLPEWKESPLDDILENYSMRVMNKQSYDRLLQRKGINEHSNS